MLTADIGGGTERIAVNELPRGRPDSDSDRIALAVLCLGMALLAFELVSTRLFSVIIWNHFAFLAISIALFGFGVAGVCVYVLPGFFTAERAPVQIRRCLLVLPLVIWAVVAVLCSLPIRMDMSREMFSYLAVIFLVTALPFGIGGLGITLALTHWPARVNRIYAFDLIGSALGCVLVIVLLSFLDGPSAALMIGVIPALGALVLRRTTSVVLLIVALVAGVAWNSSEGLVRIRMARSRVQAPLFERWNAFSRVTVVRSDPWLGWWVSPNAPERAVETLGVQIDADAFTPLVRYDGDLEKVGIVLADVTAAAYHLRPDAEAVLVIGAGGGKDVLAALASGAKYVRAVELNSLIVRDVVSEVFRDFTGDLYNDPRVDVVIGDGRAALRHDENLYDVLQIAMVDTSAASAAGAYALTENSLYTVDAAREYFRRLRPGGVLTATWANFPNLEGANRLVAVMGEALRREGHAPVSERIAVVGAGTPYPGSSMPALNVIVRPDGFSPTDVEELRRISRERDFRPVYVPGDPLSQGRPGSDVRVIRRIVSNRDLEEFFAGYPLDLTPVDDERPFFFYQNRFRDARKAFSSWRPTVFYGNGLFILVKLVLISGLAVLGFMLLPLVLRRRDSLGDLRGNGAFTIYYVCLGVGFIMLEIALVQLSGYYLGHPLLGLGVSLASLLLFTGWGSALGGRWRDETVLRRLFLALAGIVALGALYAAILPEITRATIGWPGVIQVALVAALVAPLGLLLGLPFPAGLRLLEAPHSLAPWMWAINSGATVFGATLATMAVMHLGFTNTILAGAGVYAVALCALLAVKLRRSAGATA